MKKDVDEKWQAWEKCILADLTPALKHIRKSFDYAHLRFGLVTKAIGYAQLHDEPTNVEPLMRMKAEINAAAAQDFDDLLAQNTPPAIFEAFFNLYMEGLSAQILRSFEDLLEIGGANEKRLGLPHVEWAESRTKDLIHLHTYDIEEWVREVCDKRVYNLNSDLEETLHWKKWQAPMLLFMMQWGPEPYEPAKTWQRVDVEISLRLIKGFSGHYIQRLETKLEKAAGRAALELAKQPQPVQAIPSDDNSHKPSVRRETRKLDTQAMYQQWQREYRKLKKSHPEKSDAWCSQRIAQMKIANDRSAETIRKHIKQ